MGPSPYLQMGRIDIAAAMEEEFNDWYNWAYIPGYLTVPGCIRARRYLAVEGQPKYLTVYEFENAGVPDTPEWTRAAAAIRGTPACARTCGSKVRPPCSAASPAIRNTAMTVTRRALLNTAPRSRLLPSLSPPKRRASRVACDECSARRGAERADHRLQRQPGQRRGHRAFKGAYKDLLTSVVAA